MDQATMNTIASGVVAALAPYLARLAQTAAKDIAELAGNKLAELYDLIKTRFQDRPAANEALSDLQQAPDDEDRQAALRVQITKLMQEDTAFADTLGRRFDSVKEDKQAANFLTQIYGKARIDNIFNVNINQAKNIAIGDRARAGTSEEDE